jgi:hypothetical protein
MPDDPSPVKMPSKMKLASGQAVTQLKGARQARLEDENRELRQKVRAAAAAICSRLAMSWPSLCWPPCGLSQVEKLEKDYKDIKKKYNQIRMAQAPMTRVVKGNTVPTKVLIWLPLRRW